MNKFVSKAKRYILATQFGNSINNLWHKRKYTKKAAIATAIRYYGDDRFAEDMLKEARKYDVTFSEYRMYHFENMDFETRRTFIPVLECTYNIKLNPYKERKIFYSKATIYERFKEFYKRDVLTLKTFGSDEKKALKEMVEKHKKLFVKPVGSYGGMGIELMDFDKEPFEKQWEKICKSYKNGCIAEEVVKQADALSQIVSGVVNTLRISTVVVNNRVEILGACWRCARQGSFVDNGAAGGVVCGLGDDGTVLAAVTEDGEKHQNHPDTGKQIVGFQIPRYAEAIELAKKLAMVCPKVRYVGWDLALTDNGWIMIEGNADASFGAWQIPLLKGTRPMLDPLMKEMKLL